MNFFYGQESLTIIQWILRGVIAYLVLLLAVKILGQRSISQLRLLDFIIAITLGNILAHPLSDEGLGMVGSITTTAVLVIMYIFSLNLTLKFRVIEKFFSPAPLPIIRNGEIIYKNLIKAKISLDFLLSELRVEKIDDIKKIAIALWEPGGRISVFLDSSYQSVTSQDMQILKPPFSLPSVVIREGTIDINALQDIDRTQEWLIDTLNRRYKTEIKDILLATIGSNYNIQIFLKKN
ncbi:DUF421 domain-containing protein [Clostridium sp. D2Q-11]|uniref:DUF421 domain-containing protein n=1 Tax=Anaeromonas frigoriresistens TaxID=2683708 RepID=A0A942UYK9_9FIRM|nr:DUF421 domain-containing protein [Anaeromonas frigoriresistens]